MLQDLKSLVILQLESSQDDENALEIQVDSLTDVVVDFHGYESLHSVETFDLATENYLLVMMEYSLMKLTLKIVF